MPKLSVTLPPPALPVTPEFWDKAKRTLSRRDPVMRGIIKQYPGIALTSRGEPFTTLARSIVGQQISVKAAETVWGRVVAALPEMTPAAVSKHGAKRLASCGLSQRKAEYFVELARHFSKGVLQPHAWHAMDDEEVIVDLTRVRGIGRWTSEMFLMFNLMRSDILPLGDIGLQRAVSKYYFEGKRIEIERIRELAEIWSPYRSVATWYLWRTMDPVPVEY
jgi:DNA-3-methyladenine glycosylase II